MATIREILLAKKANLEADIRELQRRPKPTNQDFTRFVGQSRRYAGLLRVMRGLDRILGYSVR